MATTLQEQYDRARQVMPGGVNSSVRLNKALGVPLYVERARGSRVWDLEGRSFIDMCMAHGAALLGHAHPAVDRAVRRSVEIGYVNSFETVYHEELARKICQCVPCADRIRFCGAGSEATLHLIRACRAFTGRKKIIRIEGHFHGYHEMIYIGGFPGPDHLEANRVNSIPESPGIPDEFADLIVTIPFNDPEALEAAVKQHGDEVALLILEPVNFNCGGIVPEPGYLELARKLTEQAGIVLFFDEIQSAFKKSTACAQGELAVMPDVCTIGKAIGGGFPLSAFCGRADIMDLYKPVGDVQHSGTFNAHVIPVLAGLAFIDLAMQNDFYERLRQIESRFQAGMDRIIADRDLNMVVPHYGARFDIVLGRRTRPVRYEDTFCHDPQKMLKIIRGCFDRGVYFHDYGGIAVHHGYSIQHSDNDVDEVLNVLDQVLDELQEELH